MDRASFLRALPFFYPCSNSWPPDGKKLSASDNDDDGDAKHSPAVLFSGHVVSIEPITCDGESAGPAFFSTKIGACDAPSTEAAEDGAETDCLEKKEKTDVATVAAAEGCLQLQRKSNSADDDDDPALCSFEAALVPSSGNNSVHKLRSKKNSSVSPSSSASSSRSLSQSPSSRIKGRPHLLYFRFGDQTVVCVDHTAVQSMRIDRPLHSNSLAQNQAKQTLTPPSIVIQFTSCAFRIFALSSSSSYPHSDRETYLNDDLTRMNSLLSTDCFFESTLISPLATKNINNPSAQGTESSSSHLLSSSNENGGQSDSIAVDTLLLHGAKEDGCGESSSSPERNSPPAPICVSDALAFTTPNKEQDIATTTTTNDDTNEDQRRKERNNVKRKLDAYQSSWLALQSFPSYLASIDSPSLLVQTKTSDDKDENLLLKRLFTSCVDNLADSYVSPMERRMELQRMDSTIKKIKMELEETIGQIFPAPVRTQQQRVNSRRSRSLDHQRQQQVKHEKEEDNDNEGSDDRELLQHKAQELMQTHREAVEARHLLYCLPMSAACKGTNPCAP